jgi:hypothetical protein
MMMWQIQEHLMNQSLTQARQCKWLVEMKSTLNDGLALHSLNSHMLNLGGHYLPPYIIL